VTIGPFTREAFERHKAYFACRAEGHTPTIELVKTSGVEVASYITTCQRCGKVYEVSNQDKRPEV